MRLLLRPERESPLQAAAAVAAVAAAATAAAAAEWNVVQMIRVAAVLEPANDVS